VYLLSKCKGMLDGASCAVTGTPIISSGRLASGGRVAATKPMLKWDGLARSALAQLPIVATFRDGTSQFTSQSP
jgi:hypothetical protein